MTNFHEKSSEIYSFFHSFNKTNVLQQEQKFDKNQFHTFVYALLPTTLLSSCYKNHTYHIWALKHTDFQPSYNLMVFLQSGDYHFLVNL